MAWCFSNRASAETLLITHPCVFRSLYELTGTIQYNSLYPPARKLGGGVYWIHPVCLFVCPLTFRVRPVASTVQDGFFPYLVQMTNSMRGCVAFDDPWPWPISSRSFGLDLENPVSSVASTVLDGFFLYLVQMITIIRGCVTGCPFSKSGN